MEVLPEHEPWPDNNSGPIPQGAALLHQGLLRFLRRALALQADSAGVRTNAPDILNAADVQGAPGHRVHNRRVLYEQGNYK